MGRPLKQIDPQMVENLASIFCTTTEIGAVLGCSADTIEKRFSEVYKRGYESGRKSLRRLQWESAEKGSWAMQIWLGKQFLGQKEPDHGVDVRQSYTVEERRSKAEDLYRKAEKLPVQDKTGAPVA